MLYGFYFSLAICKKEQQKYEESLKNLGIALNYTVEGIGNPANVLK